MSTSSSFADDGGHVGSSSNASYEVGLAKIDITPEYPIRLCGFTGRKTECDSVRQHIFARALAIRSDDEPAVLVAVDSIGIPTALRDEVARRLLSKRKIANERIAICSTHCHTTPTLDGVLPTMFGESLPPEHQKHIDQYTKELTDKVETVALAALDDLRPSKLSYGIGEIGFAENRRTKGGPVDHQLPVMVIKSPEGKVRGFYLTYACHCVLLRDNKISGDWAECASEEIEKKHPECVALVSIGCGADANPATDEQKDQASIAQQYGEGISAEVARIVDGKLKPIAGELSCELKTLDLPLQPIQPRAYWVEHSTDKFGPDAYYARVQLDRIDHGDKLQTEVPYRIQTWKFGNSLATIFLSGEVVVDYALRFKRECDAERIWLNAYSNDDPCYIPSERVLKEGGYEAGEAMRYYGLPAWLASGLEDKILAEAHRQLGPNFQVTDHRGTQGVAPKSPEKSLSTIQVPSGLKVELVASEPAISSPVALDFAPDGKVWVVEMHDYANTNDGSPGPPGGRIVVLEDRDHDGKYETSHVFLDHLSCPTGIAIWRKGVLIGASPYLYYAEDTDGDGKADVVKTLYSGFGTIHPQARVNNIFPGLDGWTYAANSFGGKLHCEVLGKDIQLSDNDFRFKADTGEIEAVSGRTEHGRARNDWGDWFGCDNSTLAYHFPIASQYLRRNPHVALESTMVTVPDGPASKVIPRGDIVLWPLSGPAGVPTAACGLHVYRDNVLGQEYAGDLFTCEPVNQLVHRMDLEPLGATYVGHRPQSEQKSEFLTSTDNWFRPVQVRTAPDGTLWVIDMYRYVIEHPKWIPEAVLSTLDVSAGNSLGRIYRVTRDDGKVRETPNLATMSSVELALAMDTPNGWQRDTVQQLLVWKPDDAAIDPLAKLASSSELPEVRVQALCTLNILNKLPDKLIERALADSHPGVRRNAIWLAEPRLNDSSKLREAVLKLADDPDAFIALQLACSLGEMMDSEARTAALVKIAHKHASDQYVVTAVLTSVQSDEINGLILSESLGTPSIPLLAKYVELAGSAGNQHSLQVALDAAETIIKSSHDQRRFSPLAALLSGVARNKTPSKELYSAQTAARLTDLAQACLKLAADESTPAATRVDCVKIIGRSPRPNAEQITELAKLLTSDHQSELQLAALDALSLRHQDQVAQELIGRWGGFTPVFRGRVLDTLLSRRPWVGALLAALKNGNVRPAEIDAIHRYMLTKESDPEFRQAASKLFVDSSTGEKAAIAEKYVEILPSGDPLRGQAQFQKTCTPCHEVRGLGNRVGPDLAGLKDKTAKTLIREIIDPNRAVDQRFAQYLAVTQDGQSIVGILVEETPTSVTLLGQQGKQSILLRSDLESLTTEGKSLMPEGFEKEIPPQQMADLIAFLSLDPKITLPAPEKGPTPDANK